MFKIVFLISLLAACSFATQGIDINTGEGPYSLQTWQCVRNLGYEFAIIQIWRGGHQLSDHYAIDWQNAKAAGIQYVDAYIFACNNCTGNTAENICTSVANALPSDFNGQVWLDVEPCNTAGCFVGSPEELLSYFEGVVSACTQKGLKMGVYSFYGGWKAMFGSSSFNSGSLTNLPLWYAHYNNDLTFSDFPQYKFGSWTKPNIKQWQADADVCGITADLSVY